MYPEREKIIDELAENYYNFLKSLPFDNEIYINAMKEARNKFLANCHIELTKKHLKRGYKDYRYSSDFVSEKALSLLKQKNWGAYELTYEHIIPKAEYIISECEGAARSGSSEFNNQFIKDILMERLWTATITGEENKRLRGFKNKMPNGWNRNWKGDNKFARYFAVVPPVEVILHDKSYIFSK